MSKANKDPIDLLTVLRAASERHAVATLDLKKVAVKSTQAGVRVAFTLTYDAAGKLEQPVLQHLFGKFHSGTPSRSIAKRKKPES